MVSYLVKHEAFCVQDQWMPCLQWTKIHLGLLPQLQATTCMLPFLLMS